MWCMLDKLYFPEFNTLRVSIGMSQVYNIAKLIEWLFMQLLIDMTGANLYEQGAESEERWV